MSHVYLIPSISIATQHLTKLAIIIHPSLSAKSTAAREKLLRLLLLHRLLKTNKLQSEQKSAISDNM